MKTSSKPSAPLPSSWYAMDAHHRMFVGCSLAALTFLGLQGRVTFPTQLVLTWNVFALTITTLAWIILSTKDPYETRRNARLQDASATFLFVLVVSAATASLLAVGLLLFSARHLSHAGLVGHVTLSVMAVVFSWMLVHTLFALRYAHFYFRDARDVARDAVSGGLIFPGKGSPDYLDFAYFSAVIGMTCQVSDVQISSPKMRRLVLVHGLISFAFNTAILAMFVNIIAGLV